jgi:dihydrofolate reductase
MARRLLLLQAHCSIDGFIAGPDNNLLDWITYNFSDDLNDAIEGLTDKVDRILLGRSLAEGFIPAWKGRKSGEPGVDKINNTPKTVFSTTIDQNPWGEGVVVKADLEGEVKQMKAEEGGDIVAYGGVRTAQTLVEKDLVDELILLVSPVALGDGKRLFTKRVDWDVVSFRTFECGVSMMHFRAKSK